MMLRAKAMSNETVSPKPRWIRILGMAYYVAFCSVVLAAGAVAGSRRARYRA